MFFAMERSSMAVPDVSRIETITIKSIQNGNDCQEKNLDKWQAGRYKKRNI
jgi:hypothetical protein